MQASPLGELNIGEISTSIELPTKNGSDIQGALGGSIKFTATLTPTTKSGLYGYGFLNMNKATGYSAEDEWLIDLLKIAANKDGFGTTDQLLIECIGRYEESGGGFEEDFTDSWHASYIKGTNPVTIYAKADWEIYPTSDNKNTIIDYQVYTSTDPNEDNWKCEYTETTIETLKYYLEETADGGDDYLELFAVDSSGNKIEPPLASLNNNWSYIADIIKAQITDEMSQPLSGWKYDEICITINSDGTVNTIGRYQLDDLEWYIGDGPLTIRIYGDHTDAFQVYSRPFSAQQPNLMTLELTKTITSGYSSLLSNPLYDLSTVYFDVYTASTGGIKLGTITINASSGTGRGTLTDISADYAGQNLYIEERFPTGSNVIGYEDKGRIAVRMKNAGETTYFTVENTPINDPVSIQIEKVSDIDKNNWIGTPDLEGIEYTLEYYTSKSAASSGSGAFKTWTFETNEEGKIHCTDSSYLTSGTLYKNSSNRVYYPVGWYRFYESTSESELNRRGLKRNTDIFYIEVKDDGSGEGETIVYTDKFITEAGSIYDPEGNTIFVKSDNLYGTIEPEYWTTFDFYKRDIFLGVTGPTGDATFAGTKFTVYCESASVFNGTTRYNGHDYSIDRYTNAVLVDGDELVISINANTGYGKCNYPLPKEDNVGSRFYIEETSSPNYGYKTDYGIRYYVDWNDGDSTIDYSRYTITVNDESRTYSSGKAYNTPRMGQIIIEKFDDDSNDGKAQGDSSLQGIQFAIVNKSANPVRHPYESSDADYNEVVTIVTTDSNGIAKADLFTILLKTIVIMHKLNPLNFILDY
ncbi:MAG: hypothetical protein ACI4JS_09785 [Oscillospiraceae bacterium]